MAPSKGKLLEEPLTRSVIGAFYDVYNELGFGFLEHVYSLALERDLRARGHRVDREVIVTIRFRGEPLTTQRLDLVVDGRLIVEIKSTWDLPPSAKRQLHNYLRATDLEVGLLLHFGAQPAFHRLIASNHPLG
ncbi:MAG TPA: GxxExxY protein [Gemmatimonadaceae bacterium]|nr:GxxExxY protein [Gemmatimonadaceae bacterium]